MAKNDETEQQTIDQNFARVFLPVAFAINRHMVYHLGRARSVLDLDFTSVYLLAVLAHLNAIDALRPWPPRRAASGTSASPAPLRPVLLRDLCEITRLPRETVRRRLEVLQQKGRVERGSDGGWTCVTSIVDEQAMDLMQDIARNLLSTAHDVSALLDLEPDDGRKDEPVPNAATSREQKS
ncbi:MAG: hypothetical protein CALGDGBN_02547 [Pseudomonadales bacterium]|nr:hypothetical protein [Pseudomonadales bacterium]